jgi:hypothetical protein
MTAAPNSRTPAGISINWRSDAAVVICLAVALAAGWFFKSAVQHQTQTIEDPLTGLRLNLPASWQADQDVPNVILAASDSHSASTFKTRLTVISRQVEAGGGLDPDQIVERVVQQHENDLLGYHLLSIDPVLVGAVDANQARMISYAYVVQPESVDRPFQAALPVVVQAADYLIFTADRYYVLTVAADSQDYESQAQNFELILKSVNLP